MHCILLKTSSTETKLINFNEQIQVLISSLKKRTKWNPKLKILQNKYKHIKFKNLDITKARFNSKECIFLLVIKYQKEWWKYCNFLITFYFDWSKQSIYIYRWLTYRELDQNIYKIYHRIIKNILLLSTHCFISNNRKTWWSLSQDTGWRKGAFMSFLFEQNLV